MHGRFPRGTTRPGASRRAAAAALVAGFARGLVVSVVGGLLWGLFSFPLGIRLEWVPILSVGFFVGLAVPGGKPRGDCAWVSRGLCSPCPVASWRTSSRFGRWWYFRRERCRTCLSTPTLCGSSFWTSGVCRTSSPTAAPPSKAIIWPSGDDGRAARLPRPRATGHARPRPCRRAGSRCVPRPPFSEPPPFQVCRPGTQSEPAHPGRRQSGYDTSIKDSIVLWDLPGGQRTLLEQGSVGRLAWSRDSHLLAVISNANTNSEHNPGRVIGVAQRPGRAAGKTDRAS